MRYVGAPAPVAIGTVACLRSRATAPTPRVRLIGLSLSPDRISFLGAYLPLQVSSPSVFRRIHMRSPTHFAWLPIQPYSPRQYRFCKFLLRAPLVVSIHPFSDPESSCDALNHGDSSLLSVVPRWESVLSMNRVPVPISASARSIHQLPCRLRARNTPNHLEAGFSRRDSILTFLSNWYTSFLHILLRRHRRMCCPYFAPSTSFNLARRRNLPTVEKMCSRSLALLVLTFQRECKSTYCITIFFEFIDFRPQYL
jgi:hypothetical protein